MLPADLVERAESLAARATCGLSTVLTAAFAVLLYRYGARDEVTFGRLVPGGGAGPAPLGPRGHPAVLRLRLTSETTFEDALRLTAQRAAHADANADIPFHQVARAVRQAGGRAGAPLFQLMFESELELGPEPAAGDLSVADAEACATYVRWDAHVTVRRASEGVAADWAFDVSVLDASQVAVTAGHFIQVLSAALADPGIPVARLDYLSAADRDAIEARWNRERVPYRRACPHRLIEDQSAATPDITAVQFGDQRLDYAALSLESTQLARYLRARGIRPGDMVALCMDRSAELVVAVLAVLKAGGAVVPLDAGYPPERLVFMIKDSGARVLVTTRQLRQAHPQLEGLFAAADPLEIDAERAAIAAVAGIALPEEPGLDLPAYCIYTSGSTGRPKVLRPCSGRSGWLAGAGRRCGPVPCTAWCCGARSATATPASARRSPGNRCCPRYRPARCRPRRGRGRLA